MTEETKVEPWKKVCVLGAGASGLVVMKELKEVGVEVRKRRYECWPSWLSSLPVCLTKND